MRTLKGINGNSITHSHSWDWLLFKVPQRTRKTSSVTFQILSKKLGCFKVLHKMFTGNFNQSSEIIQTANKEFPPRGFNSNWSIKGKKLNWKSLNLIQSLPQEELSLKTKIFWKLAEISIVNKWHCIYGVYTILYIINICRATALFQ